MLRFLVMLSDAAQVRINQRAAERLRTGHPWVFAADVEYVPADLPNGAIVRLQDGRGVTLGQAFYSAQSSIRLRLLSRQAAPIKPGWWRERLRAADALRRRMLPDQSVYRVVHGEADGLPGWVVDRFGDVFVMQCLIAGTDALREQLAELLAAHFRCRGILERSDAKVREREGLEPRKQVVFGQVPSEIVYREGGVDFAIDLQQGQKTGAFLDQRGNHLCAAGYSEGEVLDCFSYVGGFALQMALQAKQVTAVEIGAAASEQLRANAARNKLRNVEVVTADAFDYLRQASRGKKRFDVVILDPPAFAKSKDSAAGALRGYKEINLRAMQLLRPGGILVSASCTYHVDEARFEQMLQAAASDAGKRLQVLEKRGASCDHPVLLGLPESRYLKCFILRVLEAS